MSELAYSAALSSSSISVPIIGLSEGFHSFNSCKAQHELLQPPHLPSRWLNSFPVPLGKASIDYSYGRDHPKCCFVLFALYSYGDFTFSTIARKSVVGAVAEHGSQGRFHHRLGQENFSYCISTLADDVIQFKNLYKKLKASFHFPTIFKFSQTDLMGYGIEKNYECHYLTTISLRFSALLSKSSTPL